MSASYLTATSTWWWAISPSGLSPTSLGRQADALEKLGEGERALGIATAWVRTKLVPRALCCQGGVPPLLACRAAADLQSPALFTHGDGRLSSRQGR
jgi:hypothetical protein